MILTCEISIAQIEKQNTEQSSIIFVDHTSTNVNAVFRSEAGSGSYTTVVAGGDGEADTGLDNFTSTTREEDALGCVEVVACCKG